MRTSVKIAVSVTVLALLSLAGYTALNAPPPRRDSLLPRPLAVATPTPDAAQLRVTRAYTQADSALPTASAALTLTAPLPLHLAAQPVGVFIVVIADVRNTGSASLDLAAAAFTLEDQAGQVYLRAQSAELALILLDTPPLTTRPLPPGGQATGLLVFDAAPAYVEPLHLIAHIPGCPALRTAPFTVQPTGVR